MAAPAADLLGKSVVVRWIEQRTQKSGINPTLSSVTVNGRMEIYVSSAGRPFSKITIEGRRGGPQSNEQVGGGGTSLGGGVRSMNVNGNTITLRSSFGNFARNLRVEVAPGGGSCQAQMVVGKQVGSSPVVIHNVTGLKLEIHSLAVSGVTCSVQQSNIHAR
ncbi:MAG: hypothetical protein AB7I42_07925 [Bradyrhizobium sp.]|uniref:hypothetical protein n=1 Tax=Bradyrhizobium sp. TaxID=376 RepID=UPI002A2E6C01|nr:hypothetical protein [Bradyrhizobium sp.]